MADMDFRADLKKAPSLQSADEWIADYDRASGFQPHPKPANSQSQDSNTPVVRLQYQDHRTTRNGSVVLDFVSIDHRFTAVCFFNVKLKGKDGKNYPSGSRGQFNPPKGGKFRRFWDHAVGKPPSRWCRVHKSMRSALGALVFTGDLETAIDSKGQQYRRLKNLRLYE